MITTRPFRCSPPEGLLALLASLTVFGLGACDDGTNPAASFDPADATQAAVAVLGAFADNPALDALTVLESGLPGFAPAPASANAGLPLPDEGPLANLRALDRLLTFPSPSESAALFPADLLGTTLVYNPAIGQYEVDPAATGAPENGIRIVLYAVDPVLRQPVEPLTSVGYLDLTDESTVAADRVGIVAVIGDVTYIDYLGSATVLTTGLTFGATGYFSDGTSVVDFDLTHSWSQTDGFVLTYAIDAHPIDSQTITTTILADLRLDPTGETAAYVLTVQHRRETVTLDLVGSSAALSGTVSHNGTTVAQVSGTPDQPVFTDGDGNPLADEQIQSLGELFLSITAIVRGFDVLLIPAYLVLQVSIAMA